MSFFSDKDRDACWTFFDRHIALIPNEANQEVCRSYLLEREEEVELSTCGTQLGHLKAFGLYLGPREWKDASRDDVIAHIKGSVGHQGRTGRSHPARGQSLGQYTKYQRMVMLREFYQWLLDDEHPPQFKRMPFHKPTMEEQSLAREDRLTQDEVMAMLAATEDKRDRAIVMLLLDSGYRAGEAAALNIRDVTFDDRGARVLHSKEARGLKTRRRKVPTRITLAAAYLRDWIMVHPWRLKRDAPLFVSRGNRSMGGRLAAAGVWSVVERLARHAKIRHVHPHMFRHTAASLRAGDGWNEEMMRLHFGWSKGSDMPSLYSHVEQDYDAFALRKAGLPVKTEKPKWFAECPSCHKDSPGDAFFCAHCGKPLNEESGEAAA